MSGLLEEVGTKSIVFEHEELEVSRHKIKQKNLAQVVPNNDFSRCLLAASPHPSSAPVVHLPVLSDLGRPTQHPLSISGKSKLIQILTLFLPRTNRSTTFVADFLLTDAPHPFWSLKVFSSWCLSRPRTPLTSASRERLRGWEMAWH